MSINEKLDELSLIDFSKRIITSPTTLKYSIERRGIQGDAPKSTKLIQSKIDYQKDYVDFFFLTEATEKYGKDHQYLDVRPDHQFGFERNPSATYDIQLRFFGIRKLQELIKNPPENMKSFQKAGDVKKQKPVAKPVVPPPEEELVMQEPEEEPEENQAVTKITPGQAVPPPQEEVPNPDEEIIRHFHNQREAKEPNYSAYNTVKNWLWATDFAVWDNDPSFHWQGKNYNMSILGASIHPTNIKPEVWNKIHGEDDLVSKHLYDLFLHIAFFINQMASSLLNKMRQNKESIESSPEEQEQSNQLTSKVSPGQAVGGAGGMAVNESIGGSSEIDSYLEQYLQEIGDKVEGMFDEADGEEPELLAASNKNRGNLQEKKKVPQRAIYLFKPEVELAPDRKRLIGNIIGTIKKFKRTHSFYACSKAIPATLKPYFLEIIYQVIQELSVGNVLKVIEVSRGRESLFTVIYENVKTKNASVFNSTESVSFVFNGQEITVGQNGTPLVEYYKTNEKKPSTAYETLPKYNSMLHNRLKTNIGEQLGLSYFMRDFQIPGNQYKRVINPMPNDRSNFPDFLVDFSKLDVESKKVFIDLLGIVPPNYIFVDTKATMRSSARPGSGNERLQYPKVKNINAFLRKSNILGPEESLFDKVPVEQHINKEFTYDEFVKLVKYFISSTYDPANIEGTLAGNGLCIMYQEIGKNTSTRAKYYLVDILGGTKFTIVKVSETTYNIFKDEKQKIGFIMFYICKEVKNMLGSEVLADIKANDGNISKEIVDRIPIDEWSFMLKWSASGLKPIKLNPYEPTYPREYKKEEGNDMIEHSLQELHPAAVRGEIEVRLTPERKVEITRAGEPDHIFSKISRRDVNDMNLPTLAKHIKRNMGVGEVREKEMQATFTSIAQVAYDLLTRAEFKGYDISFFIQEVTDQLHPEKTAGHINAKHINARPQAKHEWTTDNYGSLYRWVEDDKEGSAWFMDDTSSLASTLGSYNTKLDEFFYAFDKDMTWKERTTLAKTLQNIDNVSFILEKGKNELAIQEGVKDYIKHRQPEVVSFDIDMEEDSALLFKNFPIYEGYHSLIATNRWNSSSRLFLMKEDMYSNVFKKSLQEGIGIGKEKETLVCTFASFAPVTQEHIALLKKVVATAQKLQGSNIVFIKPDREFYNDEVSLRQKAAVLKETIPEINVCTDDGVFDVNAMLVWAYNQHYKDIVIIVGSEEVADIEHIIEEGNGKQTRKGFFDFKKHHVISYGKSNPDTCQQAQIGRNAIMSNDLQAFLKAVKGPDLPYLGSIKRLFNILRYEMQGSVGVGGV